MSFFHGPVSTPESQGVESGSLIRLLDHIRDRRLNLHSLLIARHGHLILETYRHPYHGDSWHNVRSIGKGITALLAGIALHEGQLTSLDCPLLSFFPGRTVAHRDARKEAITLRHLLAMSSGVALTDADSGHFFTEPDALQWTLDAPMSAEPGTQFVYSSSNYYLLSAVLQQVTGQPLHGYAREKLFGPLGIESVPWQTSQQGITLGFGGLCLRSRDLVQIGQLVLARGRWNGVSLVPESWIDTITKPQAPGANYGFGWWLDPERGAVMMAGYGGQFLYLVPESDLLLVLIAALHDSDPVRRFLIDTFIRPTLSDTPLPENPLAADLAARAAALGHPQPEPIAPLPESARRVSGQRWQLDSNGLGLSALTLFFEGFETAPAGLILESGQDGVTLPLGLDGVLRDVLVEHLGPLADQDRMAASGAWQNDQTFILDLYSVNNPEYWRIELVFEGERVSLRWQDEISGYGEIVKGRA